MCIRDSLEHRIHRIGIEAGLELRKQLARHRRNIDHTRHRQKNLLGTGIESDLQRLGKITNLNHRSTEAHVAHYHHLRLNGTPQGRRAKRNETGER